MPEKAKFAPIETKNKQLARIPIMLLREKKKKKISINANVFFAFVLMHII